MLPLGLVSASGQRPDQGSGAGGRPSPDDAAAHAGLWLLLVSLGVGFLSLFVLYFALRAQDRVSWPPPGTPGLPIWAWLSTGLILLSSATVHAALRAAQAGRAAALRWRLALTLLASLAFLVSQGLCAADYLAAHFAPPLNKFLTLILLLAGVHALHVLGGLFALTLVTLRAWRGRSAAALRGSVARTALYCHFVDVVWLGFFGLMLFE